MHPAVFLRLLAACAVAAAAWRLGSLSPGGGVAAGLVGGLIFTLGGWPWAIVLLTFFVSSSALSRAFRRRKAGLSEKFAKGSRRDAGQVFANGGLGALLALSLAAGGERFTVWAAYLGAMAAVNADTWATELGVLNPGAPRLITTGERVEAGTSGGVSWAGVAASLAGAGLIALSGALLMPGEQPLRLLAAVAIAGMCGSLFDSLLGATVQAIYTCPACEKETERHPRHTCGTSTRYLRGWRWMNNDAVNALASLCGALIATLLMI